jgi:hypothetical protein
MKNQKSKNNFLIFNCNFEFLTFNFKLIQVILVIFIWLLSPNLIFAQEPNNKFGIHLAQPHFEDLKKVKELVNSSGGDWGYVTLVIQENDRHLQKWQEIFDLLREYHLIPIIRLATKPEGENWRRPEIKDIDEWVNFLDSLNWVVKNRYVVLFNEPNHASEWGGAVDPKSYAEIAFLLAKALKEKNKDFFVMLAGFDASAPQLPPKYRDEEIFLKEMFNYLTIGQFDNFFSGWASHSYPNPSFSGSPYDWGRGTIRTYEWELQLLRSLGVNKNLPVFITETGWENKVKNSKSKIQSYLIEETITNNYKIAFENVWLNDEKVKAVTPFVFDYQTEPFLGFSWKKYQSDDFYPQYYLIQTLPKVKGKPVQEEKGEIVFNLPKELVVNSSYNFSSLTLKNFGQAIWEEGLYQIKIVFIKKPENLNFETIFSNLNKIKPFEETDLNLFLKVSATSLLDRSTDVTLKFVLEKENQAVLTSKNWLVKIIPPPSLKFEVVSFPRIFKQSADNYEIQIFDRNERLVYRKKPVKVENRVGQIEAINNVVIGERYRVVILRPYYLPRQTLVVFKKGKNEIKFKTMLPLDFNLDGKFDWKDILKLIPLPKKFQ